MSHLVDQTVTEALTKCLTEVVEHRPEDPIDYIALCLYRHVDCELAYHNKRIAQSEMELFKLRLEEEQELRMERLAEIRQSIHALKEQLRQQMLTREEFLTEKTKQTQKQYGVFSRKSKTVNPQNAASSSSDALSIDITKLGNLTNPQKTATPQNATSSSNDN